MNFGRNGKKIMGKGVFPLKKKAKKKNVLPRKNGKARPFPDDKATGKAKNSQKNQRATEGRRLRPG